MLEVIGSMMLVIGLLLAVFAFSLVFASDENHDNPEKYAIYQRILEQGEPK